MKILLLSDVHFDFDPVGKQTLFSQQITTPDAIVVAGDVANSIDKFSPFFENFDKYNCEKYYTPGNHCEWSNQLRKEWGFQEPIHDIAKQHDFQVPSPRKTHEIINGVLLFNLFYPSDLTESEMYYTADHQYIDVLGKFRKTPKVTSYDPVRFSVSHMSPSMKISRLPWHEPSRMFINPDIDTVLRAHSSPTHLHGHTHFSVDEVIDGVRYLNKTVGYGLRHGEGYAPSLSDFVVEI